MAECLLHDWSVLPCACLREGAALQFSSPGSTPALPGGSSSAKWIFFMEKYEYFSLKTQLPELKKRWDNPLRHRVRCLCRTRSCTWSSLWVPSSSGHSVILQLFFGRSWRCAHPCPHCSSAHELGVRASMEEKVQPGPAELTGNPPTRVCLSFLFSAIKASEQPFGFKAQLGLAEGPWSHHA